ncbi:MAG: hypothetical protein WC444_06080 [Candidatus Paceibacterota bacterium]
MGRNKHTSRRNSNEDFSDDINENQAIVSLFSDHDVSEKESKDYGILPLVDSTMISDIDICGSPVDCIGCDCALECHSEEDYERIVLACEGYLTQCASSEEERDMFEEYKLEQEEAMMRGQTTLSGGLYTKGSACIHSNTYYNFDTCSHTIEHSHPKLFNLQPVRLMSYTIPYDRLKEFSGWVMTDNHTLREYPIFDTRYFSPLIVDVMDRTPPTKEQMDVIIDYLKERTTTGKVLVTCEGAHGRTGTVLAIWCGLHLSKKTDPIDYVRKHYCKEAIETRDQEIFIYEYLGRKIPNRIIKAIKKEAAKLVQVAKEKESWFRTFSKDSELNSSKKKSTEEKTCKKHDYCCYDMVDMTVSCICGASRPMNKDELRDFT